MLPIESPYKTFPDLDGKPLDNGYIYIGLPNQNPITHPLAIFWDAEGTIPAAQPLRTLNGYIVRAGTPANVYINGEYSILVQNKKKVTVFSRTMFKPESPTQTETLAATEGQRVFTLTKISYTPGIGSLKVHVDGFRLSPSDYHETARDTVTLVRALSKDQEVLFETGSGVNGQTVLDAALVPYQTPAGGSSNVKNALDDLTDGLEDFSRVVGNLYRRRVAYQLPIRFPGYSTVVEQKGYNYLFPQGLAMVQDRIYILYGATTGSSGSGSFCAIYNRTTGAYISGFSFATSYGEGIVVKDEAGGRFMYARHSSGILGRYDITNLPADLATLAPVQTFDLRFYSMLAWDGHQFTMQTFAHADNPSAPRNHFARLDENFNFKSRLKLNPLDAWSITSDLIDKNPKLQGFCYFRGGYATGYGSTHDYGETMVQSHLCGIKLLDDNGDVINSGLMYPDEYINILRGAGLTVDLIENEGVCSVDGKLFALWATSSHTNTGNYGLIITEELTGDIDCLPAAASTAPAWGLARMDGMIDHDTQGLKNPITGVLFSSLVEVIEFMRDVQLTRYAIYSTNSTITDVNGTPFGSGYFVEIETGNYASWKVTVHGQNTLDRFWVSGNEGALVQSYRVPAGLLKSLRLESVSTDLTTKTGRISGRHYNNGEEDFLGLDIQSTSTGNNLHYGGGSAVFNAASVHRWYVAGNNTTLTGTEMMRLEFARGLVLKPTAAAVPANNGEMTFELTANNTLNVRVKGSDGVVRSAALNLV